MASPETIKAVSPDTFKTGVDVLKIDSGSQSVSVLKVGIEFVEKIKKTDVFTHIAAALPHFSSDSQKINRSKPQTPQSNPPQKPVVAHPSPQVQESSCHPDQVMHDGKETVEQGFKAIAQLPAKSESSGPSIFSRFAPSSFAQSPSKASTPPLKTSSSTASEVSSKGQLQSSVSSSVLMKGVSAEKAVVLQASAGESLNPAPAAGVARTFSSSPSSTQASILKTAFFTPAKDGESQLDRFSNLLKTQSVVQGQVFNQVLGAALGDFLKFQTSFFQAGELAYTSTTANSRGNISTPPTPNFSTLTNQFVKSLGLPSAEAATLASQLQQIASVAVLSGSLAQTFQGAPAEAQGFVRNLFQGLFAFFNFQGLRFVFAQQAHPLANLRGLVQSPAIQGPHLPAATRSPLLDELGAQMARPKRRMKRKEKKRLSKTARVNRKDDSLTAEAQFYDDEGEDQFEAIEAWLKSVPVTESTGFFWS